MPDPTAPYITPPVTAFFHSALSPPYPTQLSLMPTTLFYELFFPLPTLPLFPPSPAVFSSPLLSSTSPSQPAPAPTRRLSRVPAPADTASLNSVMPPLPAPTASHITPPVTAFFHSALFPPYPTQLSLMPTTLFYELFFPLPTLPLFPPSPAVFSSPLLSSTSPSQPAPAPTRRLSRVPAPADTASLNSVMPPLPAPTASHITPPVTAFFHSALFPPYPTRLPLMPPFLQ